MADIVFNIAKGRAAELYNRVKSGDPSAARLYVCVIAVGAVSDATARDVDTFADLVTAGVTELTSNGWARKTIAAADIATLAPDDTNDRMAIDLNDQSWTGVTSGTATDLVVCYAAVASPTNAQLVPLTMHDFAITPDGSDVTATIADFFRAS